MANFNGTKGNDDLIGTTGADRLVGNQGNDTLNGGPGNDYLEGGPGSDRFVFAAGDGDDFVRDFTLTGANHDFLVFHGVLESSISVVQDGNDAVVTYDGGDTILLRNVDAAALTSEYFLFA
jgi:Ca2+-binding RTX toxin-like protein